MMTPLVDTLLVALLEAECQQRKCPTERLQRAVERVEELLKSTGYPETAKTLKQLRAAVAPPPVVVRTPEDASDADVLTGRRKRRQPVGEGR